jgi:2'-5' RNA ligase
MVHTFGIKYTKKKKGIKPMNQQTHYFFAVKIPEATKMILKNHLEALKKAIPFSRWVHEQDLHITLAFLGNAPADKLDKAIQNVSHSINDVASFPLQIHNLGIFGAQAAPRIFWADTVESKELMVVRKNVFDACKAAGFQLETRPFRPHITLARKWAGEEPFSNETLHNLQLEPLEFTVNEVVLYQTHLDRTPKYEEKQLFRLR